MKVKAIINFNDLVEKTNRVIGDVFNCSKERAEYLLEHNAIEIIEDKKEEVEEPVVEIAEGGITYDVEPDAKLKAEIKLEEKPKKKKNKK